MTNFSMFSSAMVDAKRAHDGNTVGAPLLPVLDKLDRSGVHKLNNQRLIADVGYGLSKDDTKNGISGYYPQSPATKALLDNAVAQSSVGATATTQVASASSLRERSAQLGAPSTDFKMLT